MTQCNRHGEQTTRLHDPGVGAVSADADRRAADDRLGLNFQAAGDPLALAQVTLYLPTRRACRLARDVFLKCGDAALLPRIVPIGDVDADELAFAEAAAGETSEPCWSCRTRSAGWSAGWCWPS